MRKHISVLLCISLMLCLFVGCGNEPEVTPTENPTVKSASTISVWYVDNGNRIWENLSDIIKLYNNGDGAFNKINVITKTFPSEAELLSKLAITGTKPNIIICSSDFSSYIAASDYNVCTSRYFSSANLSDIITEYLDSGKLDGTLISIPIAVSANIIISNNYLTQSMGVQNQTTFSTIENICSTAYDYAEKYGQPFFSSHSFSQLFRILLAQKDVQFHAYKDLDIQNEKYVEIYNLLAESAFDGGITSFSDNEVTLVSQGKLAAALVDSADVIQNIDSIDDDSVTFYACPSTNAGKNIYQMNITSLMMLDGKQAANDASAEFVKWLLTKSYDLTDGTGHLPTSAKNSAAIFNSAPSEGVYGDIISVIKLHIQGNKKNIPATDSDYYKNSQFFESNFRDTLIALN